jgi:hypothetical protein
MTPEHDEDEEKSWFNIFTLHQNRDLGRGTKNCVHESMIPEWMDLVSGAGFIIWKCMIIVHPDQKNAGCLGPRARVLD